MPRILVADDLENNRKLLKRQLETAGYEVTLVVDGQEALEAVTAAPPDLAILDVMMPRLDGFDACRKIRAAGITEVPIIALTSLDDSFGLDEAKPAGFTSLMFKPWRVEELLHEIERLLLIEGD